MIDFNGFNNMMLITGKGWGKSIMAAQEAAYQFATAVDGMNEQMKGVLNAMKTDKELAFEEEMLEVYESLPGAYVDLTCPECGEGTDLITVIIELNDTHGWSRERIADWVDELHDNGWLDLSFKEKDDRS